MNKFLTISTSTALLLGAFIITSCSSDDGTTGTTGTTFDGNSSPAAIDASNVEAIGKSAGESVQKADASTGLPGAITITTSTDMNQINNIVLATANISDLPASVDISSQICTSGTASSTFPTVSSGPADIVTTYSNCLVIGSEITIDGKATIHYDDILNLTVNFSITYSNFTVTDPVNGTTTINLTIACTDLGNCTLNSDFVGTDGVTHRVTEFTITVDATNNEFSGSATFFHGTYGEVTITITGVTYGGSCGDIPNGGDISFTSSDGSAGTITFNPDCTTSGSWTNSAGSGTF